MPTPLLPLPHRQVRPSSCRAHRGARPQRAAMPDASTRAMSVRIKSLALHGASSRRVIKLLAPNARFVFLRRPPRRHRRLPPVLHGVMHRRAATTSARHIVRCAKTSSSAPHGASRRSVIAPNAANAARPSAPRPCPSRQQPQQPQPPPSAQSGALIRRAPTLIATPARFASGVFNVRCGVSGRRAAATNVPLATSAWRRPRRRRRRRPGPQRLLLRRSAQLGAPIRLVATRYATLATSASTTTLTARFGASWRPAGGTNAPRATTAWRRQRRRPPLQA